jgi:hypothetical protein
LGIYKNSEFDLSDELEISADSGFQGIQKLHSKVQIPEKSSKLHPLNETQKKQNTKKHLKEFPLNISIENVKYLKYVAVVLEVNIKIMRILGN